MTAPVAPLAERLSRSPLRAQLFLAPWWVRGLLPALLLAGYAAALSQLYDLGSRAVATWVFALAVVCWVLFGVLTSRVDARLRASVPPVSPEVWQRRADVAWRGTATDDPDLRAWARWLVERDVMRLRGEVVSPFWWSAVTLWLPVVLVAAFAVLSLVTRSWVGLLPMVLVAQTLLAHVTERRLRRRREALLSQDAR